MFAFTSPTAEPLLLLFFGVLFLVVATGIQIRLSRKQTAEAQEMELLGSESTSMTGTLQSQWGGTRLGEFGEAMDLL